MQDLWNEICFIVNQYKQANASENNFQIEVENIFEKLGWSRYKGEVISQKVINVGSAHSVRPDIVISDGADYLLTAELKKPGAGFVSRNADQLISYMRLLRLDCGLLFGESVRVFYDVPGDGDDPIEIADIAFTENNADGVKLLETIKHEGFSAQRLTDYCVARLSFIDAKRNAAEIAERLCTPEGAAYIAESVRSALAKDNSEQIAALVTEMLEFGASRRGGNSGAVRELRERRTSQHAREKTEYRKYDWDPNERIDELERHPREGESFQDYVKRTMQLAFSNGMLSDAELRQLQDLEYCKRTFELGYPLLVIGRENITDRKGRNRYWTKPIHGNYYCCSQWWKARIPVHEELFAKWVDGINNAYTAR